MEYANASRKGTIFIVSAPSGCGKTTLCQRLTRCDRELIQSVSATTRAPRPGERDRRDYFFVTKKEFLEGIHTGEFLEWAEVLGFLYGTPRRFVEEVLKAGKDILLSIDVQGAMKLKSKLPGAILLFLMPPNIKILQKRLEHRKTESKIQIQRRLYLAKKEMTCARQYDYIVVNDDLKKALQQLRAIIQAERLRVR